MLLAPRHRAAVDIHAGQTDRINDTQMPRDAARSASEVQPPSAGWRGVEDRLRHPPPDFDVVRARAVDPHRRTQGGWREGGGAVAESVAQIGGGINEPNRDFAREATHDSARSLGNETPIPLASRSHGARF